jgi:hypothetical protein
MALASSCDLQKWKVFTGNQGREKRPVLAVPGNVCHNKVAGFALEAVNREKSACTVTTKLVPVVHVSAIEKPVDQEGNGKRKKRKKIEKQRKGTQRAGPLTAMVLLRQQWSATCVSRKSDRLYCCD